MRAVLCSTVQKSCSIVFFYKRSATAFRCLETKSYEIVPIIHLGLKDWTMLHKVTILVSDLEQLRLLPYVNSIFADNKLGPAVNAASLK